ARSFAARTAVPADIQPTNLDSLINKRPAPLALDIILKGAERIVEVTDQQAEAAVRLYLKATHNLAEPGGAAALAALRSEQAEIAGRKVAVVLSGANLDTAMLRGILSREDAVKTV
ncbi:MAG: pyridoxal-phosphate dependent enzyme, partial [Hyphomicrobiales bacterium]|nr:pyridoxal-phosphate dependent enzyme [Hyphomicrobiales bacterium]